MERKKRKFYLFGLLYDWSIELFLGGLKKRIAEYIYKYNLLPILDICCGTGKQCHLVGKNERGTGGVIGLDVDFKMMNYAASKYPYMVLICADAARVPIKNKYLRGAVISYALHDKLPEMRMKMLEEARRLLTSEGKIVLIDFEQPWNILSRIGRIFTYLIERMAGKEHFRNGQQFLSHGGLRKFIDQSGLVEIERHNIGFANSSIVVAEFS